MARPRLATGAQRLNEATTSAARISSPLWNGTPWRNVILFVNPSSLTSIPSASIGTVLYSASKVNSASNMFQSMRPMVRCATK